MPAQANDIAAMIYKLSTIGRSLTISLSILIPSIICCFCALFLRHDSFDGSSQKSSRASSKFRFNRLGLLRRRSNLSLNRCLNSFRHIHISLQWHTARNHNDAPHIFSVKKLNYGSCVSFRPHGLLLRSLRESNPRKRFCRASAKPLTQETITSYLHRLLVEYINIIHLNILQ